MKMQVCAVRDSAADAYMNPFCAGSIGIAVRSFSDEVNRNAEGNALNSHPGDFELHHLGEFDPSSGAYELLPRPSLLIRAKDVLQKVN